MSVTIHKKDSSLTSLIHGIDVQLVKAELCDHCNATWMPQYRRCLQKMWCLFCEQSSLLGVMVSLWCKAGTCDILKVSQGLKREEGACIADCQVIEIGTAEVRWGLCRLVHLRKRSKWGATSIASEITAQIDPRTHNPSQWLLDPTALLRSEIIVQFADKHMI